MADLPYLALSIRQPWAWAIIHAGKDIENRDWPSYYRGPICLHAAKVCARHEYESAAVFIDRPDLPPLKQIERGGIVGVAEIVDCIDQSASRWFFGRYGLVLSNVRAVPFLPVKGALGMFRWRACLG